MLLKQVYEVDPLQCPECGGEMKIISFIRDPRVIFRLLDHLDMLAEPEGEPTRGPPANSSITGACPAPRCRKPIADFSALGRRSFSRLLRVYKFKAQEKSVRNAMNSGDSGGGVGDSSAFEYEYDETDRLVREVRFDDAGDTVYGLAYSYDGVGNRLLQEDLVTGDTTGYSYGADNRMLSAGDYDIEKMC